MKFKFKAARTEEIEVDIDFPVYRRQDIDYDSGSSVIISRIEADGTEYSVQRDRNEFELKIHKYAPFTEMRLGQGSDPDYTFGRGQYKSDADEFDQAVISAFVFLRQYPGYSKADEINRLRAENSGLAQKVAELQKQLDKATLDVIRLTTIRTDVANDVRLFGIGFTVHTSAGQQRLAPDTVSFIKPDVR
jgi:hypothetical protein